MAAMTCLIVHLPFPTSKSKTIVQFQTVDVPGVIHDVPLKSIKDICLGPRHELLVVNCCFVLSRPVLVCFFHLLGPGRTIQTKHTPVDLAAAPRSRHL